jgi:hypothetical protein
MKDLFGLGEELPETGVLALGKGADNYVSIHASNEGGVYIAREQYDTLIDKLDKIIRALYPKP